MSQWHRGLGKCSFHSYHVLLICNIIQQNEYAVQVSNDVGYEWENGEQEVNIFLSVFVLLTRAEF